MVGRTEIGGIMIVRTGQSERAEERHQMLGGSLVQALTAGHRVQLIEHFEQQRARLMDGAHDCATFEGQAFQQGDAAGGWWTVQTSACVSV